MLPEIDRFCNWLRRRSPHASTAVHYRSDLHIFFQFLDKPFSTIRPADVDRFVVWQAGLGHKAATVNRRLAAVRAFYDFLFDEGRNLPNPVLIRRHYLRKGRRLPRSLRDDDLAHLFAAIDHPRDRAIFVLMVRCGLRCGEVTDLLLEDLDLPGRRLRITRSKGAKDRTVYLTDVAVEALRDYLTVRGPGAANHLFLYRHRPLCKDLVRDRLKAKGKLLGIRAYPYRLRHTCATQLLNAGARLETIQYQFGHERLHTTQVYARVHDETAAGDYYRAMAEVEERVALEREITDLDTSIWPRLLALLEEIAQSRGEPERQEAVVAEMRRWIALGASRTAAAVQKH